MPDLGKPVSGRPIGMAFQIKASPEGQARTFTRVSATCEALFGVTPEAAMADAGALYSLVLPEHIGRMVEAESQALTSLNPFRIEIPFRVSGGETRWFSIASAPAIQDDGSTLWDGFLVDITERLETERRLKLALETTRIGLWEFELDTGRLYWSARTKELYGLSPDEPVTFERYQAGVHPDDVEMVSSVYGAALEAGGGDFSFEHRTISPQGEIRWVLAHGRVIAEDGAPRLVVGTSLDITERKQVEEARSLLLGELSHRVKNDFQLMAAVLALQARRSDQPAVKEELLRAQQRIVSIAQAHENIYADPASPTVEMREYLDGICLSLQAGVVPGDDIAIRRDLDAIHLERDRAVAVGMILNELITNSLKHAFKDRDNGAIDVSLKTIDGAVALIVRDDGPGLDGTDSKGLGQGLIRAFVKRAGGELDVLPGPGAAFQVRLPR